jgi:trk system potassium uptake protein TrkA
MRAWPPSSARRAHRPGRRHRDRGRRRGVLPRGARGHPPGDAELRRMDKSPVKRVMIAGGGNIGHRLARRSRSDYQVKVIDRNKRHASGCAASPSCLEERWCCNGDATDEKLLERGEHRRDGPVRALTNDDENNIMSACWPSAWAPARHGADQPPRLRRPHAGRPDRHRDLAGADTIGSLLAHVRRGDVAAVHSLRRGAAEALELVVHGDARSPPRWSAAASRRSA